LVFCQIELDAESQQLAPEITPLANIPSAADEFIFDFVKTARTIEELTY
jgi:hypothetical protein